MGEPNETSTRSRHLIINHKKQFQDHISSLENLRADPQYKHSPKDFINSTIFPSLNQKLSNFKSQVVQLIASAVSRIVHVKAHRSIVILHFDYSKHVHYRKQTPTIPQT